MASAGSQGKGERARNIGLGEWDEKLDARGVPILGSNLKRAGFVGPCI